MLTRLESHITKALHHYNLRRHPGPSVPVRPSCRAKILVESMRAHGLMASLDTSRAYLINFLERDGFTKADRNYLRRQLAKLEN